MVPQFEGNSVYTMCKYKINKMKGPLANTKQIQSHIMPRPDIAAIGTQYRRIPIMSIGKDIYNDTRLILKKLEELYPSARNISATSPDQQAIERLLEFWFVDGGIFARASQLIPIDAPLLKDPAFQKDRAEMTGRKWDKDTVLKMLPEAQREIKSAFEMMETTLLADGREWIFGSEGPMLGDIEGAL
jgi:glutathione S-transferase